jgi:hypothetical protein
MNRLVAVLCLVSCLGLLGAGCPPTPPATQAPQMPKLVNMKLVGQRICGPFTSEAIQYAFTCGALPTTVASGWQLTPVRVPSIADPTRTHLNRIATLTVSGPSGTEIDVEFVVGVAGPNRPLTQVDLTQPPGPGEVGIKREVGVSAADDGNEKTWTVSVNVSPCADMRHLQLFNRAGSPPVRKGPLDVSFFRDPADEDCSGGGVYSPPGSVFTARTGPGDPVNDSPTGPCPGNAPRTLFHVCENCAFGDPQSANSYTGYEGCDWNEVLNVFGYTGPAATKPQICTIRQATSREDCEGPP